jgi:hypothetical protein
MNALPARKLSPFGPRPTAGIKRLAALLPLLLIAAGWDPGLQARCVASPYPDRLFYYEDTTGCIDHRRWLVAVHSGKDGSSCPGPPAQSFPINVVASPATMGWEPYDGGWAVTLSTEYSLPHPCGEGYWTWFMFQDHERYDGGPFPRPDQLQQRAFVNYQDRVSDGSAKAIARWQGWWDGKGRAVELVLASEGLGDGYPDDPLVINSLPDQQYVLVDGAALGISLSEGTTTRVRVPWHKVVKQLVDKNYLDAPLDWTTTITTGVGLGHEVKNDQYAHLWFAKFRVDQVAAS